ncbi:Myblike DNAbinding domain-containing protein [Podila epigama]|nr:Myblike DNAbinding domain-containing protein [Podila epigama]
MPRLATLGIFKPSSAVSAKATTNPTKMANDTVKVKVKQSELKPLIPLKPGPITRPTRVKSISWTAEIDAKIKDMRLEGNSWKEIGEAVGLEPNLCHQRYMKALDPTQTEGWTPQKIAELNAMVAAKMKWRDISQKLLLVPSVCRAKWQELNPNVVQAEKRKKQELRRVKSLETAPETTTSILGRHHWTEKMEILLYHLKEQGLTWRQIGNIFGMAAMTVYFRYQNRIKPRLEAGWVPPEINSHDTPYYLTKDRVRPTTLTSSSDKDQEDQAIFLANTSSDFSHSVEHIPGKYRTWSAEEDAFIVKHRNEGYSFKAIGDALDIDPRRCFLHYYLDLDTTVINAWTPIHTERLQFYIDQGLTWPAIAAALGFHRLLCKNKWAELQAKRNRSSDNPNRKSKSNSNNSDNSSNTKKRDMTLTSTSSSATDQYNTFADDPDEDSAFGSIKEKGKGEDEDVVNDLIHNMDNVYGEDSGADSAKSDDMDDNDLLDTADTDVAEDTEGVVGDGSLAVGRSSKKHKRIEPAPKHSVWDLELYIRHFQRKWSIEQENMLIRHVIQHGVCAWEEISKELGGSHSADECRAYWKFLDMPVIRSTATEMNQGPQWEPQFWRLWLERGSHFEEIAKKLPGRFGCVDSMTLSAADCEELFKERTKGLLKEVGSESVDSEEFQKACVELALARCKPPAFHWTKERSVKLQKLVRQRLRTRGIQVNWVNWKWVARHVGAGASSQRCNVHWKWLRKRESETGDAWTDADTLQLEQGIREIGPIFNHDIPVADGNNTHRSPSTTSEGSGLSLSGLRAIHRFYLPNHTLDTLQRRYFLLSDKASQVTVDEYMTILGAVEKYGDDRWDEVVEAFKEKHESAQDSNSNNTSVELPPTSLSALSGWTMAPCRRVWQASYKYTLQHVKWTPQEDEDLRSSVRHFGENDWICISRFFPGKTAWQCRLRWCSLDLEKRS